MPDIVPPHRDERSGKRSGAFDRKDAGWRSNECGADGQYRSTSCSPRVRNVRKQPSETENYSRTNLACTLYSSLIVLKSSGSSATAPSAMSADAFMLRMTTALL